MPGTLKGGQKAAITNKTNDPNFYRKIGKRGGQNGHTGGFYMNRELARTAGALGGRISRRTGVKSAPKPLKIAIRKEAGGAVPIPVAVLPAPPIFMDMSLSARLRRLFQRRTA